MQKGKKRGPKIGSRQLPPPTVMGRVLRDLRMEHNNPFGDLPRAGISQRELARKAGVGMHIVHLYESGKTEPWKNLEKVLAVLGYELEIVKQ